jgi:CelD/BcsL family acetyltransferase involved in cellulose biosynthesis
LSSLSGTQDFVLRCEVIPHLDRLADIADAWNAVSAASSWRSIFSTPAYARLWYSRFAAPDDVRVCHVTDGDRSIGFLPLVLTRKGRLRRLSSLTNDHAKHSVPAVLPGWEGRFYDAVAAATRASTPSPRRRASIPHGCTHWGCARRRAAP